MENLIYRVNVGDALTRSAATRPGQLAVVDGARRWTYADFDCWVNRLTHGLAARGYVRGDALGLASGNSAEFLAVYFACAKLGVVCVPVTLAGGPRRWPTSSPIRGPAAWSWRVSWSRR